MPAAAKAGAYGRCGGASNTTRLPAHERAASAGSTSCSSPMPSRRVKSSVSAPAGQPPHTHKGAQLRRAVRYDATKEDAVIGPMASIVDEAGAAHELGGEFHGQIFDERPFMEPALEKNLDRFHSDWGGSIGD